MDTKLNEKYLLQAYRDAYIKQYCDELQARGYKISMEKNMGGFRADILAEKDNDKKVYEFKMIGKGGYRKDRFDIFYARAEELGVEPIVVYYQPPIEKEIVFDDLGDLLNDYIIAEEIPNELDRLSTHTMVEEVYVETLVTALIQDSLEFKGNAIISGSLQFGSESDQKNNDGLIEGFSFPMEFTVELDKDLNIIHLDYEIDTSDYYE